MTVEHKVSLSTNPPGIHCDGCDFLTQDIPGITTKGCIDFMAKIIHCDGCHQKTEDRREHRKRLNMDIPESIYKEMKMMAIKYNCTLTKYVLRTMCAQLQREKDYEKPAGD